MEPLPWQVVLAAAATSEIITVALLRIWIPAALRAGLAGRDMNKPGEVRVAEAGGVWVIFSTILGLLALESYYAYTGQGLAGFEELATLAIVLALAGFIGFLDDALGWKRGLPVWQRLAFMALVAAPLSLLKHGVSKVELPLVGVVDFGVLYPLLIVPAGVVGAANAFNMLAGYNGLEAGMGFLLLAFSSIYLAEQGEWLASAAALVAAGSLLGFASMNWYPARVFPGNTLTYGVGAYYAGLVVIGDFQKFGLTIFSLYFLELALFLRGLKDGVYKQNFGRPLPDGTLARPYEKAYSVTHLAIIALERAGVRPTEARVSALVLLAQTAVGLAALALY